MAQHSDIRDAKVSQENAYASSLITARLSCHRCIEIDIDIDILYVSIYTLSNLPIDKS